MNKLLLEYIATILPSKPTKKKHKTVPKNKLLLEYLGNVLYENEEQQKVGTKIVQSPAGELPLPDEVIGKYWGPFARVYADLGLTNYEGMVRLKGGQKTFVKKAKGRQIPAEPSTTGQITPDSFIDYLLHNLLTDETLLSQVNFPEHYYTKGDIISRARLTKSVNIYLSTLSKKDGQALLNSIKQNQIDILDFMKIVLLPEVASQTLTQLILQDTDYIENRLPAALKTKSTGLPSATSISNRIVGYILALPLNDRQKFANIINDPNFKLNEHIDILPALLGTPRHLGVFTQVKSAQSFSSVLRFHDDTITVEQINNALSNVGLEHLRVYSDNPFEFPIIRTFQDRQRTISLRARSGAINPYWTWAENKVRFKTIGTTAFIERITADTTLRRRFSKLINDELLADTGFTARTRVRARFNKKTYNNVSILDMVLEAIITARAAAYYDASSYDTIFKSVKELIRKLMRDAKKYPKEIQELEKEEQRLMDAIAKEEDPVNKERLEGELKAVKKDIKAVNKVVDEMIEAMFQKMDTFVDTRIDAVGKELESENENLQIALTRIREYRAELANIAETISSMTTEPTPDEYRELMQRADDAYIRIYSNIDRELNQIGRGRDFVDVASEVLADTAELHEYFRELMGGDEVYLPASGSFPAGDKLRVERTTDSNGIKRVQIFLVSVKSAAKGSVNGAASEFIKYPIWNGTYKELTELHLGWRANAPFGFPVSFLTPETFAQIVGHATQPELGEDAKPVIGIPIFASRDKQTAEANRDRFAQFSEHLVDGAIGMAHTTEGIEPHERRTSGNKTIYIKGKTSIFPGDKSLRSYLRPPEDLTGDISPIQQREYDAQLQRHDVYTKLQEIFGEGNFLGDAPSTTDKKWRQNLQGCSFLGHIIDMIRFFPEGDPVVGVDTEEGLAKFQPSFPLTRQQLYVLIRKHKKDIIAGFFKKPKMDDGAEDDTWDSEEESGPSTDSATDNIVKPEKLMMTLYPHIMGEFFNVPELEKFLGNSPNVANARKRGPMSVFNAIVFAGALSAHDQFSSVLEQVTYSVEYNKKTGIKRLVITRVPPAPASAGITVWSVSNNLFQPKESSAGESSFSYALSDSGGGFNAGTRVVRAISGGKKNNDQDQETDLEIIDDGN